MGFAQKADDIESYINKYKDLAIAEMQRSGVPASITLAQGIHETEAGNSDLVRRSNNHFGIKCKNTWTGSMVYHDDDKKGECFRSYDKAEDSYRDHSDFLRNSTRYSFLFKIDPTDYTQWAYGLKKAGYATNSRYPEILIKLIEDYNLQQYTLIAMGKATPAQENLIAKKNDSTASVHDEQLRTPTQKNELVAAVPVKREYPEGEFEINKSRVIFEKAGTSLLSIAEQYHISLKKLVDFNELESDNVLLKDQLVFLVRKRKLSDVEFHIVKEGETVYDISQSEGIRYESLLEMNRLANGQQPAIGEKIYLHSAAPSTPLLNIQQSR
ncbi:MAG: glucosaminidase domain-containing protein [Bacteroidetes bacterium]|nr:glucosaminidase domain-containing protein [Bacteroidota bacterium]